MPVAGVTTVLWIRDATTASAGVATSVHCVRGRGQRPSPTPHSKGLITLYPPAQPPLWSRCLNSPETDSVIRKQDRQSLSL